MGVVVSNRTNRQAIEAADLRHREALKTADKHQREALEAALQNLISTNNAAEQREYEEWRKEVALSTITQLLTLSSDASKGLWRSPDWNAEELPAVSDELSLLISGSRSFTNSLRVLTNDLPEKCAALTDALQLALGAAIALRSGELTRMTPHERREAMVDVRAAFDAVYDAETYLIASARQELGIDISPVPPSRRPTPSTTDRTEKPRSTQQLEPST